jgi:tetratricopeptide (TPR) repeat protein
MNHQDHHGLELSGATNRSLDIYAEALRAFNCYRGDPVAIIDRAIEIEPGFAMGHILRGHLHVSLWEKSVVPEVEQTIARLRALPDDCNDRERRHIYALQQWADGDWEGARSTLERLSAEYPRDLLALQMGHLCDFFLGDRENLRGRIARALPHWTREDPGYPFLLGFLAFGQEECGAYAVAEETGRHALELEAEDCWAHHAVTHVLEMQCRQAEGIAFMASREKHWAQPDNAFMFHNWWHNALFHLDQGNSEGALEIYDRGVRAEESEIQLMLLDAAALLWRLHLQNVDVGNRWGELADRYASDDEAGFYAFNDAHAMLALIASGREVEAKERLEAVASAARDATTNAQMSSQVGLGVARGIYAFGTGDYAAAVDFLLPLRNRTHTFGGSHAQRDLFHRTLIEAATRAGDTSLARALIQERCALRPECPFTWKLASEVDARSA